MKAAANSQASTGLRVVIAQQSGSGLDLSRALVAAGHEVASLDLIPPQPGAGSVGPGGFDVAVITVGARVHGHRLDLSAIVRAALILAPALSPGATVILSSVTWPGTTQDLLVPLLEAGSGLLAGADFFVGYSPAEAPARREVTSGRVRKVVSGIDAGSLAALEEFYGTLVDRTVAVRSPRRVELGTLLGTLSTEAPGAPGAPGAAAGTESRQVRTRLGHVGSDRCAVSRRRGYGRQDGRRDSLAGRSTARRGCRT